MFKAIVSRDNGCPWGSSGQTSATWLRIPTLWIPIAWLTATQTGIYLASLADNSLVSFSGDQYPHVILHEGTYYLEDGHHRVVRAALHGDENIEARLLRL